MGWRARVLSQLVVRGQLKCIAVRVNKRKVAISSRDGVEELCVSNEFRMLNKSDSSARGNSGDLSVM